MKIAILVLLLSVPRPGATPAQLYVRAFSSVTTCTEVMRAMTKQANDEGRSEAADALRCIEVELQ